jgi:hypothetical protein
MYYLIRNLTALRVLRILVARNQPVAYYFSRGSTKAEVIVQFLKEVFDTCQKAGLQVVATVCDMGTNNVKALKLSHVWLVDFS